MHNEQIYLGMQECTQCSLCNNSKLKWICRNYWEHIHCQKTRWLKTSRVKVWVPLQTKKWRCVDNRSDVDLRCLQSAWFLTVYVFSAFPTFIFKYHCELNCIAHTHAILWNDNNSWWTKISEYVPFHLLEHVKGIAQSFFISIICELVWTLKVFVCVCVCVYVCVPRTVLGMTNQKYEYMVFFSCCGICGNLFSLSDLNKLLLC